MSISSTLQKTLTDINFDSDLSIDYILYRIEGELKELCPYTYEEWINKGRDINHKFQDGCTLLHYAVAGSNINVLKVLLRAGADVNTKNQHKKTPLHFAAISGNLQAVNLLLQAKADVNVLSDRHGNTLLHWAARKGSIEKL